MDPRASGPEGAHAQAHCRGDAIGAVKRGGGELVRVAQQRDADAETAGHLAVYGHASAKFTDTAWNVLETQSLP